MPARSVRAHGEAVEDSLRNFALRRLIRTLARPADPPFASGLTVLSSFPQDADAPVEEIHVRDAEVFDGDVMGRELGQEIGALVVVRTQVEVLSSSPQRCVARDTRKDVEPLRELRIDERRQPLEIGLARRDALHHRPGDLANKRGVALAAADPAQCRGDRRGYPRARRCSCQHAVVKLSCPCRQRRRTRLRRNRNTISATLDGSRPTGPFLARGEDLARQSAPASSRAQNGRPTRTSNWM